MNHVEVAALRSVMETLEKGHENVEVFAKVGRSRSLTLNIDRQVLSLHDEAGWAVRAGDDRRSFFHAVAGVPTVDLRWPTPAAGGLRLAQPLTPTPFVEPDTVDRALVGENEAQKLLATVASELESELPKARLLEARLDDGSSEARLLNNRGLDARIRRRLGVLRLHALLAEGTTTHVADTVAIAAAAQELDARAAARRLVDLLTISRDGQAPERDRGEMLLAPAVMIRILAALLPLFLELDAEARVTALSRSGRLASTATTLIDDGRFGLLAAAVDGEGNPTRAINLVERGVYRQPLVSWAEARGAQVASGCVRRDSWREPPRRGISHFYLAPDNDVRVADLLTAVARGYYLIDLGGAPRIDLDQDRLTVPVRGFALDGGRPKGAISGAWLSGSLSGFLAGIAATARDLTFLPIEGLIGAPTTLVRGLELRRD
ncbi:MAG: metallopeptidase TldD-related protein [Acidobacteriota bacterium]